MKRLARSIFWWPDLDKHIEETVRKCASCQECAPMPPKATPSFWPDTYQPWSRVHIDYAGPIENCTLLIIVDSHTKWIEVCPVGSATAANTVIQLQQVFARFGIPDCIVSDNGTCFTGEEFQQFVQQNGIRHLTTAPYHPASNGLAERSVRVVKNGLIKIKEGDMITRVSRVLINYRRTPLAVSGLTPSELMFGRNIKSRLDLLQKDPNQGATSGSIKPGDSVFLRNYGIGKKWSLGIISKHLGNRMFLVKLDNGNSVKRHVDQLRRRNADSGLLETTEKPTGTPHSEETLDKIQSVPVPRVEQNVLDESDEGFKLCPSVGVAHRNSPLKPLTPRVSTPVQTKRCSTRERKAPMRLCL